METNKKAHQILKGFVNNKKIDFKSTGWREKSHKMVFHENAQHEAWKNRGPFSREDAIKYRPLKLSDAKSVSFNHIIPKELHNKKFSIDDFEVHVIYHAWDEPGEYFDSFPEDDYEFKRHKYKRTYYSRYKGLAVCVNYHGVHLLFGKYEQNYQLQLDRCAPDQSNWFHIKPTKDKPFIMREAVTTLWFDIYDKIEEFFENLDVSSLKLEDTNLEYRSRYSSADEKRTKKVKKFNQLSREELDFEWFVKSETKDGVYRPERATIERIFPVVIPRFAYDFDMKTIKSLDKKLLKNLTFIQYT